MRPRLPRPVVRAVALGLLLAAAPLGARADEVTGDWTGTVQVTGNYYWERSTRVVAPEVAANLESPNGTRVRAHYLVDAITSASQATGVQADRAFTEVRNEVGLGVGKEFDLGDAQLDLDLDGRYSHEPDYRARAIGVSGALYLAQRATALQFSAHYWNDRVGRVLRFADDAPDGGPGGMLDPWPGNIDGVSVSLGLEQALTPRLVVNAGYHFAYLSGFLSNPYRKYVVDPGMATGGQPFDENHPDQRARHAVHAHARWEVPGTQLAVHGLVTGYRDDWDIMAINPEVKVYQRLADVALVRVRYAFYAQTEAFFNGEDGFYTEPPEYGTNDPKMTEFTEHELGAELTFRLPFLETRRWNATLAVAFDYTWRTNAFGDAVMGQAALRIPF